MKPTKFRKKPVEIEAIQFTKELCLEYLLDESAPRYGNLRIAASWHPATKVLHYAYGTIETLEGKMKVSIDDWIIKGVKGEFYPCKPDIFEATYDKVEV